MRLFNIASCTAMALLLLLCCTAAVSGSNVTLPPLPYTLNALEPVMSAHLLDVHYSKHHVSHSILLTMHTIVTMRTLLLVLSWLQRYSTAHVLIQPHLPLTTAWCSQAAYGNKTNELLAQMRAMGPAQRAAANVTTLTCALIAICHLSHSMPVFSRCHSQHFLPTSCHFECCHAVWRRWVWRCCCPTCILFLPISAQPFATTLVASSIMPSSGSACNQPIYSLVAIMDHLLLQRAVPIPPISQWH